MGMTFVDRGFESMLQRVPELVNQFLVSNYGKLGHGAMGVAVPAATLWLGIKVLRVYTGHEKADAWSFTRTILTVMCVFWALSWGGLAGTIYKAFVGFRDDTLRLLYDNKSMWQYVAEQNQAFVPMIVVLLKENFLTGGGMVIAGLFLQTVSTVLAAIVIFLRVTSDLGAGVVMLLLPLFVPFLFWEQTRGHLMHWFGAMLKFMLIGILLGISVKFNYDLIMPLVTSVTATHGAEAAYDNVSAALTIQGWSILFLGFGLRPLASALAASGAAGSGALGFVAGAAMSKVAQALGGGKAGGGADAAKDTAQAMQQMSKSLDKIEKGMSGGSSGGKDDAASVGADSAGSLHGEPSGAGQPGGPGSTPASSSQSRGDW